MAGRACGMPHRRPPAPAWLRGPVPATAHGDNDQLKEDRMPNAKTERPRRSPKNDRYWSAEVSRNSNALDLDRDVFTWRDPRRIAHSLKTSAEASDRRKARPYQSAMSMLNF
jgi:hypothetical protein